MKPLWAQAVLLESLELLKKRKRGYHTSNAYLRQSGVLPLAVLVTVVAKWADIPPGSLWKLVRDGKLATEKGGTLAEPDLNMTGLRFDGIHGLNLLQVLHDVFGADVVARFEHNYAEWYKEAMADLFKQIQAAIPAFPAGMFQLSLGYGWFDEVVIALAHMWDQVVELLDQTQALEVLDSLRVEGILGERTRYSNWTPGSRIVDAD